MKTKQKTPVLITLSEYVQRVRRTKDGKNCTHQTLHARKNRKAIEFVVGGNTPEWMIDITKYPPEKFRKEPRGRKKAPAQK